MISFFDDFSARTVFEIAAFMRFLFRFAFMFAAIGATFHPIAYGSRQFLSFRGAHFFVYLLMIIETVSTVKVPVAVTTVGAYIRRTGAQRFRIACITDRRAAMIFFIAVGFHAWLAKVAVAEKRR